MEKKRCESCIEKISTKCLIISVILCSCICCVFIGLTFATTGSKDTESSLKKNSNFLEESEENHKIVAHPMFKPVEKKGVKSREELEKMRDNRKKVQIDQKDQITRDLDKKLLSYINSKRKTQAAVNVNLTTTEIIKNISSTKKSTTNYASLVVTTSLMVTTMATATNPYDQPVCKSLGLGK